MVSVWLGKGELVAWRGGWGMGREHNFPGRVSAPPRAIIVRAPDQEDWPFPG